MPRAIMLDSDEFRASVGFKLKFPLMLDNVHELLLVPILSGYTVMLATGRNAVVILHRLLIVRKCH